MIAIKIAHTSPLPCGVRNIKDFTINCRECLFLDRSGCKITKWCKHTQTANTMKLERKYAGICYDDQEDCYWAASSCDALVIYQLDSCFHEVGHIVAGGVWQQHITGISCDSSGKGIWISYPCQLAFMDKCSRNITWFTNENRHRDRRGILLQCGYQIVAYKEEHRELIEVISPCGKEQVEVCVPKEFKIVGMAPEPCKDSDGDCSFCVLLLNAYSQELVLNEYNVFFSHEKTPVCSEDLCCQNQQNCHEPCRCHQCIKYELIHSIALEEMGISHILNAEGEKIQKAIELSCTIDDLICVNESVRQTLTQVTLLEGQLYSKLDVILRSNGGDCCCEPCDCNYHAGYEIIHSIAMEESGISCILNAEGSKIQKAVAMSTDIDDLICVNESVKRTLMQIELLEGQLYAKLEGVVNSCDFSHNK